MPFTLRLLTLRCIQAQEADGDEVYLKLNGEEIFSWSKIGVKFYNNIKSDKHTNAFDFQSCQYATKTGNQKTAAYNNSEFVFKDLDGEQTLELWESDKDEILRGDDDLLGGFVVSEEANGEHIHVFPHNGAEYELKFVVT